MGRIVGDLYGRGVAWWYGQVLPIGSGAATIGPHVVNGQNLSGGVDEGKNSGNGPAFFEVAQVNVSPRQPLHSGLLRSEEKKKGEEGTGEEVHASFWDWLKSMAAWSTSQVWSASSFTVATHSGEAALPHSSGATMESISSPFARLYK